MPHPTLNIIFPKLHLMKKINLFYKYPLVGLIAFSIFSCQAQSDSKNRSISKTERSIVPYKNPEPTNQIAEYIRNIYEDNQGNLWMGTNGYGVVRYDGKELKYFDKNNGLSGSQVTDIMQAKDGKMWFATYGGLSVYNGESFHNYTTEDGLQNEWMWSVYEDSKGQIWAGSVSGLSRLSGNIFVNVDIPDSEPDNTNSGLKGQWVRDFLEVDGDLWIGTAELGICIYNGNKFSYLNTKNGLCDNDISSLMKDTQGNIWIGTRFGGVCKYDGETFVTYDAHNGIGNDESIVVYEDQNNNIWFSSEGYGLYKFDGTQLINYAKDKGLEVQAVQTIFEDSKGRFWTGGGGGLYRLYGDHFINVTKQGPWN